MSAQCDVSYAMNQQNMYSAEEIERIYYMMNVQKTLNKNRAVRLATDVDACSQEFRVLLNLRPLNLHTMTREES